MHRPWAFLRPLGPPPAHTERPRVNDRRTIEGNRSVLLSGCRRHDLPRASGAPTIVWRTADRSVTYAARP